MSSEDKLLKCMRAAARAKAIDVIQVAHCILKAVEHRHSPEQALASLRKWQPRLFRDICHLDPRPLPSLDDCVLSPESIRVGVEMAMRELLSKKP